MKIIVNNIEYGLNKKEVKVAKKVVGKFIEGIKDKVGKKISFRMYFTILITMHLVSQRLIDEMDEEDIKRLFGAFGK